MPAKYLVRFDDICPTMNWTVWREIENALGEAGVKPILAVVPDNKDPELMAGPAREGFWHEVREWQRRGWTIGLHGYQHRYVTENAGIMGRNRYSEFAGLPYPRQLAKLRNAAGIFEREGVHPDLWIAPAHSFDANTLRALAMVNITTVSDGYSVLPHVESNGVFWIPQQLGRLRAMPGGVWTACHHHNNWTAADLTCFRRDLKKYQGKFSNVAELEQRYSGRSPKLADRLSSGLMAMARMGRIALSR